MAGSFKIIFKSYAEEDIAFWFKTNQKVVKKIYRLLDEIAETPFQGTGKPEPLQYGYSGCWSRRIDLEHRLVYRLVKPNTIEILACRYHYR